MVDVVTQGALPVRFLIDRRMERDRLRLDPWALYRFPLEMLQRWGLPYEVMPHDTLRVGRRLHQMIKAMGFAFKTTGCCDSCTQMEFLLNFASAKWISEHSVEIAKRIEENAVAMDVDIPRKMIELALFAAVILERRAQRKLRRKRRARQWNSKSSTAVPHPAT